MDAFWSKHKAHTLLPSLSNTLYDALDDLEKIKVLGPVEVVNNPVEVNNDYKKKVTFTCVLKSDVKYHVCARTVVSRKDNLQNTKLVSLSILMQRQISSVFVHLRLNVKILFLFKLICEQIFTHSKTL